MNRISEYTIVEAPGGAMAIDPPLTELQNVVSHRIREGWQPLGGIATAERLIKGIQRTHYVQAMVKYTNDK